MKAYFSSKNQPQTPARCNFGGSEEIIELSPVPAFFMGMYIGAAEGGKAMSQPLRLVGVDFSAQDRALEEAWRRMPMTDKDWTRRNTQRAATVAAISTHTALGVKGWNRLGGASWGFGVGPGAGRTGVHLIYGASGWGRGSAMAWYHVPGLGTAYPAGTGVVGSMWFTVEGVPILFPAAATGIQYSPNCLTSTLHSFVRGMMNLP